MAYKCATAVVGDSTTTIVFDLTDTVQEWATGVRPVIGFGIVHPGEPNSLLTFSSMEGASPPQLEIIYDPSTIVYQADIISSQDTMVMIYEPHGNWGGAPHLYTTQNNPPYSADRVGFIQWDLPVDIDDKTINEAKIHLYSRIAYDNTSPWNSKTVLMHAMAAPWVQGTGTNTETFDGADWFLSDGLNYWPNYPYDPCSPTVPTVYQEFGGAGFLDTDLASGAPIVYGSLLVTEEYSNAGDRWFEGSDMREYDIDVTELVQKWADGDLANNGIRLSMLGVTDVGIEGVGFSSYDSGWRRYAPPTASWGPRLQINYTDYSPACNDRFNKLDGDINNNGQGDCYVNAEDLQDVALDWLESTDLGSGEPITVEVQCDQSATGFPEWLAGGLNYPHDNLGYWIVHFGRMDYTNVVDFPCGWESYILPGEMMTNKVIVHDAHISLQMRTINGGPDDEAVMSLRVEALSQQFYGGSGSEADPNPQDGACYDNPIGLANGGDLTGGIDWDGGTRWGLDAIVPGYTYNTGLLPKHEDAVNYLPVDIDVTELVQDWSDGVLPNYGVIFIPQCTMETPEYRAILFDMDVRYGDGRTSDIPILHITYEKRFCLTYSDADLNKDCVVDFRDYSKFAIDWMDDSVL